MARATAAAPRWRLLRRAVGGLLLLSLLPAAASLALPGLAHARGDRLLVVLSGSMTPVFRAGDAILVRPVEPGRLRPGLVVTFRAGGSGAVVTHRLVALRTVDGHRYLQTKGDANAAPDPDLTPASNVVAQLDASWAGAGRWVMWTQSRQGRQLLLGPALVLVVLSQLLWHVAAARTRRRPVVRRRRPARRPRRVAATPAMLTVLLLASVLPLALSAPPTSGATLSDVASVTANTLTSGSLLPPTNLSAAAAGGGGAALTWTATTSTIATGYLVLRSSTIGGPYTQIATVSGGTSTSYTDSTATGTVYYVVQSSVQSWSSANSTEAALVSGTTTTPLTNCALQNLDTGGNGNGYEVTPMNACAKDTVVAQDLKTGTTRVLSCTDPGKDRHQFWAYNLPVPAGASAIKGLQVQLDAYPSTGNGTGYLCVQLSGDAGLTWTTPKQTVNMTSTTPATYLLGSTSDLWGTTWTPSQLSNANFRVRVIDVDDTGNKGFSLDYVGVKVTYMP